MGPTASKSVTPVVYDTERANGCLCNFEDFRGKQWDALCPVCAKLGKTVMKASHPRARSWYNAYYSRRLQVQPQVLPQVQSQAQVQEQDQEQNPEPAPEQL